MTTVPPFRSEVDKTGKGSRRNRWNTQALTGLSWGQLTRLSILVYAEIRSLTRENAKEAARGGLLDSVAMGGHADAP